jgi:hypothetical protein
MGAALAAPATLVPMIGLAAAGDARERAARP